MRLLVLAALFVAVLGTTVLLAVPCLIGITATRTTVSTSMVSVLCVQPTSVGWLCKEIIKIFRLRGSAGTIFPYNANAFAGLVLVAHRSLLANAQARFFILCYIDFLLI